jgi:diguanylate cyclase (GGDEF)-like protein
VSRAVSGRCTAELSRGRLRILFFIVVAALALVGGHAIATVFALVGAGLGAWSVSLARRHGCRLAHTVATADWILLGICLAVSGGTRSWIVVTIPLLVLAHLVPSARATWPYLLAPVLLTAIVVAIADPSMGGNRAIGLLELTALAAAGVGLAAQMRQSTPRRVPVTSVDHTTGLYARSRLATLVGELLDDAAADHAPMSVVAVRLDHFSDARDFYGAEGSEAIVAGIARRLKAHMGPDDVAFRARTDTLVVALRGQGLRDALAWADDFSHETSAHLVAHHRQTVTTGAASYPPLRTPGDLVGEAFEALRAPQAPEFELALAVAQ